MLQFKKPFIGILLVSVMTFGLLGLTANDASAFTRHHQVHRRRHHPRRLVTAPPAAYKKIHAGRRIYYYRHGIFYRKRPWGYATARPPVGIVVRTIPGGRRRVLLGGGVYFNWNNIFYREVPTGYIVVAPPPPPETAVVSNTAVGSRPVFTAGEKVSVTAAALNVRFGPDKKFSIIRQVHKGDILTVRWISSAWLYVELPSGESGYIARDFVVPASGPAAG